MCRGKSAGHRTGPGTSVAGRVVAASGRINRANPQGRGARQHAGGADLLEERHLCAEAAVGRRPTKLPRAGNATANPPLKLRSRAT